MKKNIIHLLLFVCIVCGVLSACAPTSALKDHIVETTDAWVNAKPKTDIAVAFAFSPEQILKLRADEILDTMTLSEKVGQMFFAHNPQGDAIALTKQYQPGGYILFAADFQYRSADAVRDLIQGYQDNSEIPMLIGVDEEGGTVNRVSRFPQFHTFPFQSPQTLYQEGGWDRIIADTIEKAALLKSLGITVNLAPVCDVTTEPTAFMFARSFGGDTALTAEYVQTVVQAMIFQQLGCVLKHFPGYGDNGDTHLNSVTDERPFDDYLLDDFKPFQAGIDAGAGAVLISHNIVVSMDADKPASLSAQMHQILRQTLGFEGVIMTDDLNMTAVNAFAGGESTAVLAVLAGNDMMICPDFDRQIPAVIAAVEDGTISESRIDASARRVLIWKLRLGILE